MFGYYILLIIINYIVPKNNMCLVESKRDECMKKAKEEDKERGEN